MYRSEQRAQGHRAGRWWGSVGRAEMWRQRKEGEPRAAGLEDAQKVNSVYELPAVAGNAEEVWV